MLKIPKRRIIAWIMVVIWMGVIFMFSHQNADESSKISSNVSYEIVKTVDEIVELEKEERTIEEIAKSAEKHIRKTAHFIEYFILGILLLFAYLNMKNQEIKAFLTGVIYAMSDEFHQGLIDGRGPLLTDVLIDSAGVILGILLLLLFLKQRKGKVREEKYDTCQE